MKVEMVEAAGTAPTFGSVVTKPVSECFDSFDNQLTKHSDQQLEDYVLWAVFIWSHRLISFLVGSSDPS